MDFLSLSSTVKIVLQWQIGILAGLSLWVLGIVVFRRTWGRYAKTRELKLQEFLVEQVLRSMENQPLLLPKIAYWEEKIYRNLLINTIISLQGREREALVKHYFSCGFLGTDEHRLHSKIWWHRLRAVIRLSQLSHISTTEALMRASADSNHLVAQIAVEALSRLSTPTAALYVLEQVKNRPPKRDDLLVDLLLGSSTVLGVAHLLSLVDQAEDRRVQVAAIQAIGKLGSLEAIPLLLRTSLSTEVSEELTVASLKALKLTADPRAENAASQNLSHQSARVRLAAVELAVALHAQCLEDNLHVLETDVSFDVRRVVHSLKSGRAA